MRGDWLIYVLVGFGRGGGRSRRTGWVGSGVGRDILVLGGIEDVCSFAYKLKMRSTFGRY